MAVRNSLGHFVPGCSGNPAGKAPRTEAERAAAVLRAQAQPDVIRFLVGVMNDEASRMSDRLTAAKALMDASPVQIEGEIAHVDGTAVRERLAAQFARMLRTDTTPVDAIEVTKS